MRNAIVLAAGFLILALVNYGIYQKEQLLAHGRVVLLELAPVDPRSLMQGDYMALRFRVQTEIPYTDGVRDGRMVVAVDDRGVAQFRRMDDGTPLAADELKIFYRVRENQVRLGTNVFFFQEREGHFYNLARYGEARVDKDGQMLLTGLRGQNLEKLGPP